MNQKGLSGLSLQKRTPFRGFEKKWPHLYPEIDSRRPNSPRVSYILNRSPPMPVSVHYWPRTGVQVSSSPRKRFFRNVHFFKFLIFDAFKPIPFRGHEVCAGVHFGVNYWKYQFRGLDCNLFGVNFINLKNIKIGEYQKNHFRGLNCNLFGVKIMFLNNVINIIFHDFPIENLNHYFTLKVIIWITTFSNRFSHSSVNLCPILKSDMS